MYCYLLRYSTPQPIIDKTTELDSILGYTRCSYRLLIQFDVIYFIKLYSSFLSFFLFSLTISLIYSTLFTNAITQLRSNFRREMGFLVFPASTFFSISLHFFVSFFPFRFFLCAMIAQNVCVWALFIGGNKRPRRPCVRAAAAACTDGGEEVAEEERERKKIKIKAPALSSLAVFSSPVRSPCRCALYFLSSAFVWSPNGFASVFLLFCFVFFSFFVSVEISTTAPTWPHLWNPRARWIGRKRKLQCRHSSETPLKKNVHPDKVTRTTNRFALPIGDWTWKPCANETETSICMCAH